MFDKRYQVDRTFFTVKNFPNHVEAASRIRYLLFMHACMDVWIYISLIIIIIRFVFHIFDSVIRFRTKIIRHSRIYPYTYTHGPENFWQKKMSHSPGIVPHSPGTGIVPSARSIVGTCARQLLFQWRSAHAAACATRIFFASGPKERCARSWRS